MFFFSCDVYFVNDFVRGFIYFFFDENLLDFGFLVFIMIFNFFVLVYVSGINLLIDFSMVGLCMLM